MQYYWFYPLFFQFMNVRKKKKTNEQQFYVFKIN